MPLNYTDAEATRCIALLSLKTPFTLDDVAAARREIARVSHPDLFHAQGAAAAHQAQERMKSVNAACDYLEQHFTHLWSRTGAEPWATPPPQAPPDPASEKQYESDSYFRAYRQEFEKWAAGQPLSRLEIGQMWRERVEQWPQNKKNWKRRYSRKLREEDARRRQKERERQESLRQTQERQQEQDAEAENAHRKAQEAADAERAETQEARRKEAALRRQEASARKRDAEARRRGADAERAQADATARATMQAEREAAERNRKIEASFRKHCKRLGLSPEEVLPGGSVEEMGLLIRELKARIKNEAAL